MPRKPKERPWCKCDDWYKAVLLEFIRWDEKEYCLRNGQGMNKYITHCPFCGKCLWKEA